MSQYSENTPSGARDHMINFRIEPESATCKANKHFTHCTISRALTTFDFEKDTIQSIKQNIEGSEW